MNFVNAYLSNSNDLSGLACSGPMRQLSLHGRSGLQPLSICTRCRLDEHTLNTDQGAVTFWLLPTESLASTATISHIHEHHPGADTYVLLSDNERLDDWGGAHFTWVWSAAWYPQWWAKFYQGGIYPDAYSPPRAAVTAGHFHFEAWHWVQIGLTWDKPANQYRLYANGILIATCNQFASHLEHQPCGRSLYFGNPTFAFGELMFYDKYPDASVMADLYRTGAALPDVELNTKLRRTFAGAEPTILEWMPDSDWLLEFDHALNTPDALDHFYVQGYQDAPSVTPEGLLVETRLDSPGPDEEDQHQVYLWTRRSFEGDFALEFEFQPTLPNGLSLLMLQANGMHGEDFMADYPLRTTGSMKVVYGEAVRNYHWEFFRGMDDTRNDVASNALIKQPWQQPLAYHCGKTPLELHAWHKLQFVQDGNRLRGAIDGIVVFDVKDGPGTFTGHHYTHGHLAIRCMTKTRNVYRNLRIWTKHLHPDLKISESQNA